MSSNRSKELPAVLSSWEDLVDESNCAALPGSTKVTCFEKEEVESSAPELGSRQGESSVFSEQLESEVDHSLSLSKQDSSAEVKETQILQQPADSNDKHAALWNIEDQDGVRTELFKEGHPNLLDLDFDTLCRCLELLSLRDVCTVSQCCRRLREAAYSDLVWQALFKRVWPNLETSSPHPVPCDGRDSFLVRWKACRQLRFSDPAIINWRCETEFPVLRVFVNSDQTVTVLTSQRLSTWSCNGQGDVARKLSEHERASKTDARPQVVPIDLPMLKLKGGLVGFSEEDSEPCLVQSGGADQASGEVKNTAPSASEDSGQVEVAPLLKEHFFLIAEDKVRLYSSLRGYCRTLSGASTEKVLAITNRIFELPSEAQEAVIAVGGTDKIVRLWTLGVRTRGKGRLLCSLRGHKDAVAFLRVAKHDPSLLVSVGTSGIVKLWDIAAALELRAATAGASRSCLATWKVTGPTAGVAVCRDVCYIAGDTKVTAVNFTSLQVLGKVAVHASRITAMALNATGNRLCTGLFNGCAYLWDPSCCDFQNPKPLTELAHRPGIIRQILIDSFKIVTRTDESSVHILDAETGSHISTFPFDNNRVCLGRWLGGTLVMAMRGPFLVIGKLRLASADFSNSVSLLQEDEKGEKPGDQEELGRFWERPSEGEDDEGSD